MTQQELRSRKFPLMERVERINQREEKIKESKIENPFIDTYKEDKEHKKFFTKLEFNKGKKIASR